LIVSVQASTSTPGGSINTASSTTISDPGVRTNPIAIFPAAVK
jgi:hypothetical protein